MVGNGSLTLSLGGRSFTVTVGEPGNTLADIRNAINSATDNPGISASIINAADGAHLVLSIVQDWRRQRDSSHAGGHDFAARVHAHQSGQLHPAARRASCAARSWV